MNVPDRGIHWGHRVDFRLGVSGRFKIGSCIHIDVYIIVNPFLSRIISNSVTTSSKYQIIESVLNTSSLF